VDLSEIAPLDPYMGSTAQLLVRGLQLAVLALAFRPPHSHHEPLEMNKKILTDAATNRFALS
jgi:hypothetical protein